MKPIEDFFFGGLYFFCKTSDLPLSQGYQTEEHLPQSLRKEISKSFLKTSDLTFSQGYQIEGSKKKALGKKVTP